MNIVYNLKKFFTEQQNEAAIPGLGVFYKSNVDENGNELPEGESVVLFIEKTPRSNAFVNFLGYEENLTENDSIEVIEDWVSSILNDLKTYKVANISELGRFEIEKDKVLFIPASNQNLRLQQTEYGLEELPKVSETPKNLKKTPESPVIAKPKNTNIEVAVTNKPKSNKRWTIAIIIIAIIVVLAGAGIACYKTVPDFERFVDNCVNNCKNIFSNDQTAKPINLAPATNAENPVATPIDDDIFADDSKPESKPETQKTEQPAKPAKEADHKAFKVIGGAFSIKANAERFHTKMKRDGYASELFFDNNRQLYYVTLGAFDTHEKALEFKERIRKTNNIDSWILRK